MDNTLKLNTSTITSPVVREYEVGGVKFIVTASTKAGARESATAKVRRLIRNELSKIG